ncbi:hypothetical protein Bca4012_097845 [Brassica carinata]|uniref:Flavin-containing monooxygenase n=3 Tax=Brassica TaxID=3705 RepID=A0ABQ7YWD4_BRANA|nr:hypothetical protein HID58_069616 [Brassica napus]CAF2054438.1 unnamed protein product [Brassica napus]CDY59892.1 BnaC06g40880D [Brassica napus]
MGMLLLKYFPVTVVDTKTVFRHLILYREKLQSSVRDLSERFAAKDSIATDRNSNQPHKLWRLYWSYFVVVATGVNGECYIPAVKGLDTFNGEIVHSSKYKSGHALRGKTVLVARGGNSSMEMSFALNNLDARMAVSTRKYGII